MRNALTAVTVMLLGALVGCASEANKPAEHPASDKGDDDADDPAPSGKDDEPKGEEPKDAEAKDDKGLPSSCAKTSGDICLPSNKFVSKICQGDFPTVALALFAAGTPWKRAYLTHETNAWDASGGGASNERLKVDEEVIILRHRAPSGDDGGIQVSGATDSYDALRWDGMCVTLDASELRFDPPSKPFNARIIWTRLEIETRDALKENEDVRKVYIAYKAECKGVTVGEVTKKCEQLDGQLSLTIANHMRGGGTIPTPKKLP